MNNHIQDKRFKKVMLALAEASGQESTPVKESIYAQAFEDVTIDQIEKAAWEIIRNRKPASFPKIGEIRELIFGNPEDFAEIEARKVYTAIRHVGGYQDVVFDNATTQAVITQGFGGWAKLCGEMTEEQQKWFIKDFARMYTSFAKRGATHYGKLDGRGQCSQPQLVGDKQLALEVLNGDKSQNVLTFSTLALIG